MQHYAAFHLGLHCLQKYPFREFPNTKANSITWSHSLVMNEQLSMGARGGSGPILCLSLH